MVGKKKKEKKPGWSGKESGGIKIINNINILFIRGRNQVQIQKENEQAGEIIQIIIDKLGENWFSNPQEDN